MPFGLSFAPTDQNQQEQQNRPAGTPIQDAIKILSLRIPSFVGAQGLAPDPLMQGGGAQGFPFGGQTPGGLDEFLKRLFGGGMPGQMPGGMPGGAGMPPPSIPPPIVRPGEEPEGRVPMPQPPQITVPDRMPQPQPGGGGIAPPQSGMGRTPPKIARGIF